MKNTLYIIVWFLLFFPNSALTEESNSNGLDLNLVKSYPILNNKKFIIKYDAQRRVPKFVYESISFEDISGDLDRNNTSSRMLVDNRIFPMH